MTNKVSREKLRQLRNNINIRILIADTLNIPSKMSEGNFRFLCPVCGEFNTAVNDRTNLARCFRCHKNYNPIDMVIEVKSYTFLEAIDFLSPLL